MITISYIYIAAILVIIWAIYRTIVLIKSKEINKLREVLINIFFLYFIVLINLTICKMDMLAINFHHKFYVNYIPFIETIKMFQDHFMGVGNAVYNIVGNILLFVPLGFFIPLLFNKKNKISSIALYGFITSLSIEIIQLFTANNLTDIDDIIFNTLGAILGLFSYKLFYYVIKKTKLSELLRKSTSKFEDNLVRLSIKPISIMLGVVIIYTSITVCHSTIPGDASNEDIAKVVFKYSRNTDFQAVKDISEYKLFLKDEGDYVNLMSIESVLNNRWLNSRRIIDQYQKSSADYSISTIHNNIDENKVSMSIAVFGKNKNANKLEIIFNDKSYIEEIKVNEYFLVTFPSFETFENSEIDNIYSIINGEESDLIKIKFVDSIGNYYNDMKFAK